MKKRMTRSRRRAQAQRRHLASSITAAIVAASWMTPAAFAAPAAGEVPVLDTVQSGHAAINTIADGERGQKMTIDQTVEGGTHNVAIDWQSFNIGDKSTVYFKQAPSDVALNRITGESQSEIFGKLQADGRVLLINPHGVLFGRTAQVDVGSIVASTGNVTTEDMQAFAERGTFSSVIDPASERPITVEKGALLKAARDEGGIVVLHAAKITNNGEIRSGRAATDTEAAASGSVHLAAVQTMDYMNDGKITFGVEDSALKKASVLNAGTVAAESGYIALTARAADSVVSSVVNDMGARLEATGIKTSEDGVTISLVSDGCTDNYGQIQVADGNVLMQVKEMRLFISKCGR